MAKKLEDMRPSELAIHRIGQVETSAHALHLALLDCARDLVFATNDPSILGEGEHVTREFQAVVDYLNQKDPKAERLTTVGVKKWIEDIAGLRISQNGRVWPSKKVEHNEEWFADLRESATWAQHTKRLVVSKPLQDLDDYEAGVARSMAEYVAMGGMTLSDLEIGMPALIGKVKHILKDQKFIDKVAGKMDYLIKTGQDFIKVKA